MSELPFVDLGPAVSGEYAATAHLTISSKRVYRVFVE